jgi:copper chaperone CopZ
MKILSLINVLLFSLLLLSSCGKKINTETTMKTTTLDESKVESVEYKCDNMHCGSCETTITEAVKKLNGIKDISADSKSKIVKVSFNSELTNKNEKEKTNNAP